MWVEEDSIRCYICRLKKLRAASYSPVFHIIAGKIYFLKNIPIYKRSREGGIIT